MPDKILIMGGARFHGFQLACDLADAGNNVYVLNRGRYRSGYRPSIRHLVVDRNDRDALKKILKGLSFKAVIDNNAYTSKQVDILLSALKTNYEHYIFTSTAAVYMTLSSDKPINERDVAGIPDGPFSPKVSDYAYNKFKAEATIRDSLKAQNFTIIRIPNIFGENDFSNKLNYFHHRFLNKKAIVLEQEVNGFSLVYVKDVVNMFKRTLSNPLFFNQTLNFADPAVYSYNDFFSGVFGNLFDPDKIIFKPAQEMWESGHFLPLAWGPVLDTTVFNQIIKDFSYTPLKKWGETVLNCLQATNENKTSGIKSIPEKQKDKFLRRTM